MKKPFNLLQALGMTLNVRAEQFMHSTLLNASEKLLLCIDNAPFKVVKVKYFETLGSFDINLLHLLC